MHSGTLGTVWQCGHAVVCVVAWQHGLQLVAVWPCPAQGGSGAQHSAAHKGKADAKACCHHDASAARFGSFNYLDYCFALAQKEESLFLKSLGDKCWVARPTATPPGWDQTQAVLLQQPPWQPPGSPGVLFLA